MEILSFKEFKRLASQGNLIPLITKLNADTETPVSAFLKMTQGPYRFLLESMEGGEKWGRYSFLGSEPRFVFRSRGDQIEILEKNKITKATGNPLDFINNQLSQYQAVQLEGLPRFTGGMVGYFGYDVVRFIEHLPDRNKTGIPFHDCQLMLQESLIVFDNLTHEMQLVQNVFLKDAPLKKEYDRAVRRIEELARRAKRPLPLKRKAKRKSNIRPVSNTTEAQFHEMVEKAKNYIRAGDIFQMVPSQRWEANFHGDPFSVYRELRRINPSPYLFYFEMGDQILTGSSPEVMVRLEGSKITLRPIAGTRRRGKNQEDEKKMEEEMIHDPKEIAEHIMLVDLGRNDVGRVSKKGEVKVTELLKVEKYSHVMHLVSNVEGVLADGLNKIDVLKATFPAGTLTGAPKIRAMEIIEELEVGRRGPYGGAVGYFDFYGNMDTAITIRSLAFAKGKVWFQSGGGVVLDSKPELEYLESQNKAKVMMEALKRCS